MIAVLQDRVLRLAERQRIVAPLGIRFWDPALDTAITEGLTVIGYPEGARWMQRTASCTAGAVYAFHDLPGLHAYEYPADDDAVPGSLPVRQRFVVEVNDQEERFLPVCFSVNAPILGIYPSQTVTSLGAAPPGFYLFSASTRIANPVLATIRAELRERVDDTSDRPAAHAVIGIDIGDDTWLGLADERGVAAVMLPYPVFTLAAGGPSSMIPSATGIEQTWPLTVRILYQPSALSVPDGARLPTLRSVLEQAPGVIWTGRAVPPAQGVTSLSVTLLFGQELVLRSEQESVLLIGPGSMP